MKIIKTIAAVAAVVLLCGYTAPRSRKPAVVSTPKLEELPRRVIDTIATKDPDTKIIIFSNNTWVYYRPEIASQLDDLSIYNTHWDTTQIFAYRGVELNNIPASVELKLMNSITDFKAPITGRVISPYGPRGRRNHNGIDIPLKMGEPIYSMFDGKVRYAKYNTGGFGNLVIVRHANGLETWYAHLSKRNVVSNEYVKAGQVIGFGGSTGRSRGPHLHLELRYSDQTFDPQRIFDVETGGIKYQTFALERSFFNIHSRASDQLIEEDEDLAENIVAAVSDNKGGSDIIDKIVAADNAPTKSSASSSSASISQGATYYTVKKGDFPGKIAVSHGISVDKLYAWNGLNSRSVLGIGQRLRVSADGSSSSVKSSSSQSNKSSNSASYHAIKSGDTLGSIAMKYGTSIDNICSLNNITRRTVLKLGRRLRVK